MTAERLAPCVRLRMAVAGLAVVFIAIATSATAEIPPAPLGLDRDGTVYALISNSQWTVSENSSGFVPAKAVIPVSTGNPSSTSAYDRQNRAYIWAGRCTASKQTLIFRRTFFLPGPPKTFGAQFSDSTYYSPPANRAIEWTILVINGKRAFAINGGAGTVNPSVTYANLFKYGLNTIDIFVVKKARTGPTYGECQYGTPARPLGVMFTLYGEFEADLWLSADRNFTQEVYERRPAGTIGLAATIKPRNLGPSGVYKGALQINFTSVNGPSTILPDSLSVTGAGVRNCVVTSAINPIRVDCEIFGFQSGAAPEVRLTVLVGLSADYTHVWVFGSAIIFSATRDLNAVSNGWRRTRIFCGPRATHSNCPPP
jgi:hypothetical protein